MSFLCSPMTDYPKNHCFSNHLLVLSVQEFDDIYNKEIAKKYNKYEIKRLSQKKRIEKENMGAGRPFKLDVKNRFLMLLVYYRLYITYTLAGFLFDLDQSNICRDIQKIESLIRQCIPIPQKIYNITKRLKTLEEVERYFPGFLAFIDSTEQQIPRPADKRKRKTYYSGKKKRHAVKTQFMANNRGLIIHKTAIRKEEDMTMTFIKKNHPITPKQILNVFDLGISWCRKGFSRTTIIHYLIERREIMELSKEEKDYNKSHSKKRIVIEHTICRLKKYRIFSRCI